MQKINFVTLNSYLKNYTFEKFSPKEFSEKYSSENMNHL